MPHDPFFLAKCEAFKQWNGENPELWKAFDTLSNYALQKGRHKLSAWLIINRIRWDYAIETTGVDFKISNDFIAFYARRWMALSPIVRGGFFQIKRMQGEDFVDTCRRCGIALTVEEIRRRGKEAAQEKRLAAQFPDLLNR